LGAITINQFNSLAKDAKADVVYNFGMYLLHYENVRHIFSLYQLSDFYVEMVYSIKKKKVLIRIKGHPTPDTIEKYLLQIDLHEVGVK
jgi:hypothetical protein